MVMTSADLSADFDAITSDGLGLTGTSYATTSSQLVYVTDNVLSKDGATIRIEMRERQLQCETRGGTCDKPATIAAAANVPCAELRVVAATFADHL